MPQQTQEQRKINIYRNGQKHPLPLWVRWFIALFVPLIIIVGAILWIIQGAHAIIPLAVLTALGLLIAFSQVLLWLFPSIRHDHFITPPPHTQSDGLHMLSSSTHSQSLTSSEQTYFDDLSEITPYGMLTTIKQPEQLSKGRNSSGLKIDWGEAPHTSQFYGRERELDELEHWIVSEHCQTVAILGMGGAGKTSLAAKLVEQINEEFESVFWRELKNAPPLESILKSFVQFISNQQIDFPENIDGQIAMLIQCLRDHRCLFVLDNVETILQASSRSGQYREGFEGYGRLIQLVGEIRHQSCLLLTGREKTQEVALLEANTSLVRSYQLAGLRLDDGRKILKDKGLSGKEKSWEVLIDHYAGNPLALKLVSQFIKEVFDGDVAAFLREGEMIFSDIRDVLGQQFGRLSELEQEVMYWLAIDREAVFMDGLQEDIIHPIHKQELQEVLRSLRRRYLIELSTNGVTLQNVVMEYVIGQLIDQICKEITSKNPLLFRSHALMKAQSKDYVRESQVRLIIKPLIECLLTNLDKEEIERKLQSILTDLRESYPRKPGYTAGNIINLLIDLKSDLRGYDFSHIMIWQANLQNVSLPDVNFRHSDLAKSLFTQTFGGIYSVAISSNGELMAAGTANSDIRLWQIKSSTLLHTCKGHIDWIRSVVFTPDGKKFASASGDQTIRLWDVASGQCLKTLRGHTDRVWSVAFNPDGATLASASGDQTVRLWDVGSGQCLKILQGHMDRVWSVAFSPDGSSIASGSDDQTIRLWMWLAASVSNLWKSLTTGQDRLRSVQMERRLLAQAVTRRSGFGMWVVVSVSKYCTGTPVE